MDNGRRIQRTSSQGICFLLWFMPTRLTFQFCLGCFSCTAFYLSYPNEQSKKTLSYITIPYMNVQITSDSIRKAILEIHFQIALRLYCLSQGARRVRFFNVPHSILKQFFKSAENYLMMVNSMINDMYIHYILSKTKVCFQKLNSGGNFENLLT